MQHCSNALEATVSWGRRVQSAHEQEARVDPGLHVQPCTQPHSQTVGLSCFSSHLRTTIPNYLASLFFMLSFQLSKTRHVGVDCLGVQLSVHTRVCAALCSRMRLCLHPHVWMVTVCVLHTRQHAAAAMYSGRGDCTCPGSLSAAVRGVSWGSFSPGVGCRLFNNRTINSRHLNIDLVTTIQTFIPEPSSTLAFSRTKTWFLGNNVSSAEGSRWSPAGRRGDL